MLKFTSLVPRGTESPRNRACLLSFDNSVQVLADPGWDTVSDLSHLETIINSIDFILISQPTMAFLGAYAYLYKKYPGAMGKVSVFSTSPVQKIGFVETIENYRFAGLLGPVLGYQLEISDVQEAFDQIITIKYNQKTSLRDNLTITAISSGHTLGGIIWLFDKGNEKIIYAPAWNHSKDSFIEGTKMLQDNGNPLPSLSRPSVMITSAMIGSSLSYNKRVDKFLSFVDATLQNMGTVFLPVSLGSRFLELVHLIDNHLRQLPYQVYLIARTGTRALAEAGSSLEWMSSQVTREWQQRTKIPFEASTVTIIDHSELDQLRGSKIVFCVGSGLETGSPALESFRHVCNDPSTTVILTERAENGTFAHKLYSLWEEMAIKRNGKAEDGVAVPYESREIIPQVREEFLRNSELESFKQTVEQQRESEKEMKAKLRKQAHELKIKQMRQSGQDVADDTELLTASGKILQDEDDEEEEEEEEEEDVGEAEGQEGEDGEAAELHRKQMKEKEENLRDNLPLDIDVRNAKGKNRMFPYVPKKAKYDDYGEVINAKDFVRQETQYDSLQDGYETKLGEKRKFGQDSSSSNKRHNGGKFGDEDNRNDELTNFQVLNEPRKLIKTEISISTKCGLVFVDLAGLVDPRSLSLIVSGLKPRNILLLDDLTSSKNLNNVYKQLSMVNGNTTKNGKVVGKQFELIKVANNREVDIDDSFATFEVLLGESLSANLKWQKISGGYSIAQVIGTIVKREEIEAEEAEEDVKKVKKEEEKGEKEGDVEMADGEKSDGKNAKKEKEEKKNEDEKDTKKDQSKKEIGIGLRALPDNMSQLVSIRHTPLAIGDIRLKELKDLYGKSQSGDSHIAEFKGEGTLVIDDCICVRKINEGDFVVEGAPCQLFYEVRERVKAMLAYV